MLVSPKMRNWVKKASTLDNALQWDKEQEKWLFTENCLEDAGCMIFLTDEPDAMEWMVKNLEDNFETLIRNNKL